MWLQYLKIYNLFFILLERFRFFERYPSPIPQSSLIFRGCRTLEEVVKKANTQISSKIGFTLVNTSVDNINREEFKFIIKTLKQLKIPYQIYKGIICIRSF